MPSLGSLQGFQVRLIFFFFSEENRTGLLNISEHLTNATVKVKGFINRITKRPTVCSFCIIFYIITSVPPKVFPSAEPDVLNFGFPIFFFLESSI